MELQELVAQVEQNIGRDDKTSDIPTYINLALERIHNDYSKFPEWEETSYIDVDPSDPDVNPRRVPIPSNLTSLIQVRIANGSAEPLKRIAREDYDNWFPESITDDARNGEPDVYTRWNLYIEVYPVPNTTYTYYLRWIKEPMTLELDTDEPYIGEDNVIIECATMIAYNRLGLTEVASQQYQIYQTYLQGAIKRNNELNSDTDYKLKGFSSRRGSTRESSQRDKVWEVGEF